MPHLRNVPFLIFGNKIDVKEALKEKDLREVFGLSSRMTFGKRPATLNPGARPIELFMCSAVKREGYQEGFAWLSQFIT